MFSDPKYSFSVCQKYFFSVSKKVSIFHRIQPTYTRKSSYHYEGGFYELMGAFNKEKALVGAFSGHCETLRRLVDTSGRNTAGEVVLYNQATLFLLGRGGWGGQR